MHPEPPDVFAPLHEQDIVFTVPALLDAAAAPATVVNRGGDETVAVGEWTRFMGELVDREAHSLPPRMVPRPLSVVDGSGQLARSLHPADTMIEAGSRCAPPSGQEDNHVGRLPQLGGAAESLPAEQLLQLHRSTHLLGGLKKT